MTPRLLVTGAIRLAVCLRLAAEWFAAFDACLATANCASAPRSSARSS
jgi:hypothetical protein